MPARQKTFVFQQREDTSDESQGCLLEKIRRVEEAILGAGIRDRMEEQNL